MSRAMPWSLFRVLAKKQNMATMPAALNTTPIEKF